VGALWEWGSLFCKAKGVDITTLWERNYCLQALVN